MFKDKLKFIFQKIARLKTITLVFIFIHNLWDYPLVYNRQTLCGYKDIKSGSIFILFYSIICQTFFFARYLLESFTLKKLYKRKQSIYNQTNRLWNGFVKFRVKNMGGLSHDIWTFKCIFVLRPVPAHK